MPPTSSSAAAEMRWRSARGLGLSVTEAVRLVVLGERSCERRQSGGERGVLFHAGAHLRQHFGARGGMIDPQHGAIHRCTIAGRSGRIAHRTSGLPQR
jgi:hypothetical protein